MAANAPAPLDVDRLIDAAFAQLEEQGLNALSMRKLAARLNVQAPAIYWHVKDKAELLGLMARRIHVPAYADVTHAENWRDWLRQFGRALRRSFLSHRTGHAAAAGTCLSGGSDFLRAGLVRVRGQWADAQLPRLHAGFRGKFRAGARRAGRRVCRAV